MTRNRATKKRRITHSGMNVHIVLTFSSAMSVSKSMGKPMEEYSLNATDPGKTLREESAVSTGQGEAYSKNQVPQRLRYALLMTGEFEGHRHKHIPKCIRVILQKAYDVT